MRTVAKHSVEGGLRIRGMLKEGTSNTPLVSIITVVRNGETHLEQAIRSVLDQDYPNIEYLVIDGASTDGTLEIIRKNEERIDYWRSEPDDGLYEAMNKGLALARGELIGILNADDYFLPDTVRQVVEAALANPNVGVFHGNLKLLRQNGVEEIRRPRICQAGFQPYLMPVNHPTVFVRSRCYSESGSFDTSYRTAADFDLMLRLLRVRRAGFHYLDQLLAVMREGGESGCYSRQTYSDIVAILRKNSLPQTAIFRFRLWYCWLLLMQYSKRFRLVRALAPFYYQLRGSGEKGQEGRRKALFLVPSLSGGGGQRVAATLCEALSTAEDLDLVLVVFDRAATNNLGPSIKVRHIEVRESGNAFYTLGKFCKVVFQLARIIRQERPQAILGFMDYCNTVVLLASRLARSRSRVVISVHTLFSAFLQGKGANIRGRLLKVLAQRLYSKADAVVAVSRGVAEDLGELFGIAQERIRVIGNPFDLEKIARLAEVPVDEAMFSGDVPIILSVGRLSQEKGGDDLLRAFARLQPQTEARLVFLGEGAEQPRLEQLCSQLEVDDKVSFLGYQENPFRFMARSTVFVLSSRYEGFGNVLVEAMACGLPVVATRCYPGIEDLVRHGESGLLVPVGDEAALVAALARVLNEGELRRKLVIAGRKTAGSFDSHRIVTCYREVLGLNDRNATDEDG